MINVFLFSHKYETNGNSGFFPSPMIVFALPKNQFHFKFKAAKPLCVEFYVILSSF